MCNLFWFLIQFRSNATVCVDSLYKWMSEPTRQPKKKNRKELSAQSFFSNWWSCRCGAYIRWDGSFPWQNDEHNDDDESDVPFNYKNPSNATMHQQFQLTLSKYVSYILTINLLSQWVLAFASESLLASTFNLVLLCVCFFVVGGWICLVWLGSAWLMLRLGTRWI